MDQRWVTIRKLSLIYLVTVVLVASALWFWFSWWVPKAEFSCDGSPFGPSSAESAATDFADSITRNDSQLACKNATSSFSRASLEELLPQWQAELGAETASEIEVALGEQMGSMIPVTLKGPAGNLDFAITSFVAQYRISSIAQ